MALGVDVFGKQQYAGGILVEAMNESQARVGGAGAGEGDLSRKGVQDAVFLGPAKNCGKVGWFCHRYHVFVFIEDGQIRLSDRKSPVDDDLRQFYYEPKPTARGVAGQQGLSSRELES